MTDNDVSTSEYVLIFIREAVQRYPQLKSTVVAHLLEIFSQIRNVDIHRSTLWILGEYCTTVEDISRIIVEIRTALGEVYSVLNHHSFIFFIFRFLYLKLKYKKVMVMILLMMKKVKGGKVLN